MTDETPSVPAKRESAFLVKDDPSDKHIVDVLIEERCPSFVSSWTWPIVRPVLYSVLGYKKARRMADHLITLNGRDSFNYLAGILDFKFTINHLDRMPKTGPLIIAANHPTGLADGVAVWEVLREVRQDIVFFANADAVRVNPKFEDVLIPVEWVADKRTPAKTRETLKLANQAFAEEKCIVIFPSGRLANKVDGVLREKDWFSTVIGLAKKRKSAILPLNVDAFNSRLYYWLSDINGELRDITLFHELLNKSGTDFKMTFGPLIQPETLVGDTTDLTNQLRDYVSYDLRKDASKPFLDR